MFWKYLSSDQRTGIIIHKSDAVHQFVCQLVGHNFLKRRDITLLPCSYWSNWVSNEYLINSWKVTFKISRDGNLIKFRNYWLFRVIENFDPNRPTSTRCPFRRTWMNSILNLCTAFWPKGGEGLHTNCYVRVSGEGGRGYRIYQ